MKQVFINGVDFTNRVEIDISFVEKLNRELDEGYISIPHTFKKSAFTMFDIVDIYDNETIIFSGRVAMDRVTVSSFNDRLFNHEISLIEHTKVLEKYIVKGKTVTQPVDFQVAPVQTLLDVVTLLRLTTPLELFGFQTSFRPFRIPQQTADLLDPIIAPEFNFKDLTLRQALDQVGSVIDSVARIDREGNLTFTQFDKLKEKVEIVTQDYQLRKNITDYSNALESEILNATDSSFRTRNQELQEVYPGENTYTTLRTNEFLFGFTDLIHVPTPRPIYKVNELRFLTFARIGAVGDPFAFDGWIEIDLGSRVVEFENWNTLETVRNQNDPDLSNRTKFFKNNTFYFRYGKKNIFVGELFGLFGVQNVFNRVVEAAAVEEAVKRGFVPSNLQFSGQQIGGKTYIIELPDLNDFDLDNGQVLFRVYYTPLIRALRYQIHRDTIDEVDFYSEAIVNQQTRLVDIEKFGNNLKGRINQMAGSVIQLSHRVKEYSETFNVGDFILDDGLFVITQKEVVIHRDFYNVNYELTKNFNKFSQFIGVDQEIRQSEIGAADRTVERDLLYSEYVEVEAAESGSGENSIQTLKDTSVILKTLDASFEHTPLKFSTIKTNVIDDDLLIGLNKSFGGGALSLNFELEDNISAGSSNQPENSAWFRPERRFNEPVVYADERGRFERLRFKSFNKIPTSLEQFEGSTGDQGFNEYGDFQLDLGNQAPSFDSELLTGETPVIEGEWFVAKDSREVIKFNLMYHFLSRDFNEVVIGNKFVEKLGLIKNGFNTVKLWIYDDRRFDTSDKNKPLETPDFQILNPSITIDPSNNKIIINETIDEGQSYALVADNDFPYIMVNSNKTHLLFHFLNKRPAIQYLGISPVFQRLSAKGVGTASIDFIVIEAIPLPLKSKGVGVASLDFDVELFQVETSNLKGLGVGVASLDFNVGLPTEVERQLSAVGVGDGDLDIQILTPVFENEGATSTTVSVQFSNPNPFTAELFVELGISGEFEFITLAPGTLGTVTFELLSPNATYDINANMILGNFVSPTTVVFVNTTS
jgi:hypothetical protein